MQIGKELKFLKPRMILTSNGNPTVEIELITSFGTFYASCPEGKSKGKKEAMSIYDTNSKDYNGKNVKTAISNIENIIIPNLTQLNEIFFSEQEKIDNFLLSLDGTANKSKLGVNAILPVSIAFCKAGAASVDLKVYNYISQFSAMELKMPIPCFNVINGGRHSGNNLLFQEIMISFNDTSIRVNLEKAVIFYDVLMNVIEEQYGLIYTSVGMEGGFAPPIDTLEEGLDLILKTYQRREFKNMQIAIDSAASDFYSDGKYNFLKNKTTEKITTDELQDYYKEILKQFPLIFSIEDPFDEDDFKAWSSFMSETETNKINIVGDDLTTTNPEHIKEAILNKSCNTILIKPNQIGTVTETINAISEARKGNMKIMISHRSGETEDNFISDLAVGIGADYIKAGAPCRGERIAKYNQLLRISEDLENR